MLEILKILQNVYMDKLNFKPAAYREGFLRAIELIKLHGFFTGISHREKLLEEELEKLKKDVTVNIHFLKSRLQLKKEDAQVYIMKLID